MQKCLRLSDADLPCFSDITIPHAFTFAAITFRIIVWLLKQIFLVFPYYVEFIVTERFSL
nr:MAG TPA: hypothetical protein [Bacteriophage sp.]